MNKNKEKRFKDNKEKNKKIPIIATIIEILLTILIIYSGYKIFEWKNDLNKTEEIKQEIAEAVVFENDEEKINFNKLKEKNEDTVAYLKVNGTLIDHPIVQSKDNEYYLNRSFNKEYNLAGWPFLDYRNNLKEKNKNLIIYGHNMRDGKSMFTTQQNTLKEEWQENKENHIIKFETPDEKAEYRVFSVYSIKDEARYITTDFENDEEFLKFANILKDRSIYDFKIELDKQDEILTLSTCGTVDNNIRIVLHAKKVK